MTPEDYDMLGNPVEVGDYIACAFRHGNQGALQTGEIVQESTRMREGKRVETWIVDWDTWSGWSGNPQLMESGSTSWIFKDIKRYVKIGNAE